ncbi:S-layer homology domain-containing protein [Paenibacillus ferrarius]|uniref:S-layer homology domain-containing protein n=1 Tax=Paenibacillus ferrarius TaxID=1469647 RepID=UPI003D26646D
MTTMRRNSLTKAVGVMLSFMLMMALLVPYGGGTAYARPNPVAPPYTGPLNWLDYTAAGTIGSMAYTLTFDGDGNLIMPRVNAALGGNADVGSGSILKISSDDQSVTNITYDAHATYPVGIAVGANGAVYATDNDTNSGLDTSSNVARVLKLKEGTDSWTWEDITYNLTMRYAMGVAEDPQGNVYVVDTDTTTSTKTTVAKPKVWKLPTGQMTWVDISDPTFPSMIGFDLATDGDGTLYVSMVPTSGMMSGGGKILKRDAGASGWTDITPSPQGTSLFIPYGIAVDRSATLYTINLITASVKKLAYHGGSDDWTDVPAILDSNSQISTVDVAVDSQGYIYGSNSLRGNIVVLRSTVNYNGNGNTSGTVPEKTAYKPNESATVAGQGSLLKTNNTFAGWATSPTATTAVYAAGDTIPMTQSISLYAVWTPIPTYTVTYAKKDGGSISGPNPNSEIVAQGGSPASVPTVTPDPGYTFLGWSNDEGATYLSNTELASIVVNANTTYTAYFQPPVTLTRLDLDSEAYSLYIGDTHETVVTAVYSDQSTQNVSSGAVYTSSDTNIATVDAATGLVTAVAKGQADITAEYEGQQAIATVTVSTRPEPESDSGTYSAPPSDPGVNIIIDGVKLDQLAKAQQTTVEGRKETTVVLDSVKVSDKLNRDNSKKLTIPVSGDSAVVVGQLDGSLVKALETHDAQIEIATDRGSYTLPASQVSIAGIAEKFGADVKLEDLTVSIRISEASDDRKAQVQAAAQAGELELVAPPVDFDIVVSYKGQTVTLHTFRTYVERTITIPNDVDPNQITTAVVVDADGTVRHVPTKVIVEGDRRFARINSLTNSTYAVVWHPLEFSDVAKHWAKDAVNNMGSRMIIEGADNGLFNPDLDITRAEFAAILVRGLGLKLDGGTAPFSDVKAQEWYSSAVSTAYGYSLIAGFEDGTFRPNDRVTREQAMVMITQAMRITGLTSKTRDAITALNPYADAEQLSSWARDSVADSIQAGLVSGRSSDHLAPKDYITRAEVAAIVQRLLQKSELI